MSRPGELSALPALEHAEERVGTLAGQPDGAANAPVDEAGDAARRALDGLAEKRRPSRNRMVHLLDEVGHSERCVEAEFAQTAQVRSRESALAHRRPPPDIVTRHAPPPNSLSASNRLFQTLAGWL